MIVTKSSIQSYFKEIKSPPSHIPPHPIPLGTGVQDGEHM